MAKSKEQITRRQTTQHEDQERGFEIGKDESWAANMKRTYDRTEETLQHAANEAQSHLSNIHTIQQQLLSNLVENCNAVSKQMIRHGDIAINAQWNLDEQGYQVVKALQALDEETRNQVIDTISKAGKK